MVIYPIGDGIVIANVARNNSERFATAATELKLCSLFLIPPKKKQDPVTSRRLDRTLPSILAICSHGLAMKRR